MMGTRSSVPLFLMYIFFVLWNTDPVFISFSTLWNIWLSYKRLSGGISSLSFKSENKLLSKSCQIILWNAESDKILIFLVFWDIFVYLGFCFYIFGIIFIFCDDFRVLLIYIILIKIFGALFDSCSKFYESFIIIDISLQN